MWPGIVNIVNIFAVPWTKIIYQNFERRVETEQKDNKENSFTRHFGEMENQNQELKTT